MSGPTTPTDIGSAIAQALLACVQSAITELGVQPTPAIVVQTTGAAVPAADACEGMVWARVGNVYPTDGSGAMYTKTPWDATMLGWLTPVELGVLWCHRNITEDGGWIDPLDEADYAERDGRWRMVLLKAAAYDFKPYVDADPALRSAIRAFTLSPWTPIGPDGGYSGGIVVMNVISSSLAICAD